MSGRRETRLPGRRYSHARRRSAGKKKFESDGRCLDLPLFVSLSCGRNHEICRLRMPSMDTSPTRAMKTRVERHVVPGCQYSRENRTKGSVLLREFKRHPCRLNPEARVQAAAPLFHVFPSFFFFFSLASSAGQWGDQELGDEFIQRGMYLSISRRIPDARRSKRPCPARGEAMHVSDGRVAPRCRTVIGEPN